MTSSLYFFMRSSGLALLVCFVLLVDFAQAQLPTCNRIYVRREIRDVSVAEFSAFANALKVLNTKRADGTSRYDDIVHVHYDNAANSHGRAVFFPWHRYYLWTVEKELQSIDPNVVIPYWDWTLDSQQPDRSIVFSDDYFGGNGDAANDQCLTTGTFANWQVSTPTKHCLRRNFEHGSQIGPFYAPEAIQLLIEQATAYDAFRSAFEGAPHARPHIGIGGTNGDMAFMESSNDPLFWLHHAFVDRVWSLYQQKGPEFANRYETQDPLGTGEIMAGFNLPVSTVLSINDLCYRYAPPGGDIVPPPQPPPTTTTTSASVVEISTSVPTTSTSSTSVPTTTSVLAISTSVPTISTSSTSVPATTSVLAISTSVIITSTSTSTSILATSATSSVMATSTSSSSSLMTSMSTSSSIVTSALPATSTAVQTTNVAGTSTSISAPTPTTPPVCYGTWCMTEPKAYVKKLFKYNCHLNTNLTYYPPRQILEQMVLIKPCDKETKLIAPDPIPESWLMMNMVSLSNVRAVESALFTVYGYFNAQPNYLSPAAPRVAAITRYAPPKMNRYQCGATTYVTEWVTVTRTQSSQEQTATPIVTSSDSSAVEIQVTATNSNEAQLADLSLFTNVPDNGVNVSSA